jgi:hypothetical protein
LLRARKLLLKPAANVGFQPFGPLVGAALGRLKRISHGVSL